MEGVGSFLCEQRRGAEEELFARPQLQMEVGHDDSDIIQLFSPLHMKLRNQVMLHKSQHIDTYRELMFDSIIFYPM